MALSPVKTFKNTNAKLVYSMCNRLKTQQYWSGINGNLASIRTPGEYASIADTELLVFFINSHYNENKLDGVGSAFVYLEKLTRIAISKHSSSCSTIAPCVDTLFWNKINSIPE